MPSVRVDEEMPAVASTTEDMALTSDSRAASGMNPNASLEFATPVAIVTAVSHMLSSISSGASTIRSNATARWDTSSDEAGALLAVTLSVSSVSYTHLTLPTILLV